MVLKQYSQITHDDSKHKTSAKRDSASGVAGLDASKEVINDVPVSKIVDMSEQSFENLVDNGDFKLWPAGDTGAPYGWTLHGAGITVEKNTVNNVIGENCVAITYGSASCYLKARPDNPPKIPGTCYDFFCFC